MRFCRFRCLVADPAGIFQSPLDRLDSDGIEGQRNFYNMILSLKKRGKTVLLVLHDISKALEISDKIVVMNNSEIVFDGTPADCIESHIIEDVFSASCRRLKDEKGEYFLFE